MRNFNWGGLVLIVLGGLFFLRNFIDIPAFDVNWKYVWPLILVVIGVRLLIKGR